MKMTAFIKLVTEQYMASDAEVFPVDAQAARLAPVKSRVRKGSAHAVVLKLPEGFMPSYCKYN